MLANLSVAQVQCPHCGTLNDGRQLACAACGVRLIGSPTPAQRPTAATPAGPVRLSVGQCVLSCLLYLGSVVAGMATAWFALLAWTADHHDDIEKGAPSSWIVLVMAFAVFALVGIVVGLALARLADEWLFHSFPEAEASEVADGEAAGFASMSLWLNTGGFLVWFLAPGLGLLLSPLCFLAASRMGWRALREPVNHRLRRKASIGVTIGLAGAVSQAGILAILVWDTTAHL